jgi:hypothetical protein
VTPEMSRTYWTCDWCGVQEDYEGAFTQMGLMSLPEPFKRPLPAKSLPPLWTTRAVVHAQTQPHCRIAGRAAYLQPDCTPSFAMLLPSVSSSHSIHGCAVENT